MELHPKDKMISNFPPPCGISNGLGLSARIHHFAGAGLEVATI